MINLNRRMRQIAIAYLSDANNILPAEQKTAYRQAAGAAAFRLPDVTFDKVSSQKVNRALPKRTPQQVSDELAIIAANASRMVVVGIGSGATMALAGLRRHAETGWVQPAAIVLVEPPLDMANYAASEICRLRKNGLLVAALGDARMTERLRIGLEVGGCVAGNGITSWEKDTYLEDRVEAFNVMIDAVVEAVRPPPRVASVSNPDLD